MREVVVSETVLNKVSEPKDYLLHELKLSEEAALNRTERIERFIVHLGNLVDYPPCRFKRWREKAIIARYLKKIGYSPTKYFPKALSSATCPTRQHLTILRISPASRRRVFANNLSTNYEGLSNKFRRPLFGLDAIVLFGLLVPPSPYSRPLPEPFHAGRVTPPRSRSLTLPKRKAFAGVTPSGSVGGGGNSACMKKRGPGSARAARGGVLSRPDERSTVKTRETA